MSSQVSKKTSLLVQVPSGPLSRESFQGFLRHAREMPNIRISLRGEVLPRIEQLKDVPGKTATLVYALGHIWACIVFGGDASEESIRTCREKLAKCANTDFQDPLDVNIRTRAIMIKFLGIPRPTSLEVDERINPQCERANAVWQTLVGDLREVDPQLFSYTVRVSHL